MSEANRLHCRSCDRTLTVEEETFICASACSICVSCIGQSSEACPECGGELEHLQPERSDGGGAASGSKA